jgi:hypothetical protein
MTPSLRNLVLTAHVTFSVGWLGATAAYLALAVVGLSTPDAQIARAVYVSMEVIDWYIIVPFGLASLTSGLVQSLGTTWGLFRYYWILVKFLFAIGATIVLLVHMPSVSRMARVAATSTLADGDMFAPRAQLVFHAAGGLLVLLIATTLSVYKPWGLTPYGRRKRSDAGTLSQRDAGRLPDGGAGRTLARNRRSAAPRWVYVVGFHALGLFLLVVVLHLAGIAPRMH